MNKEGFFGGKNNSLLTGPENILYAFAELCFNCSLMRTIQTGMSINSHILTANLNNLYDFFLTVNINIYPDIRAPVQHTITTLTSIK